MGLEATPRRLLLEWGILMLSHYEQFSQRYFCHPFCEISIRDSTIRRAKERLHGTAVT